jgi:hypothetical protein
MLNDMGNKNPSTENIDHGALQKLQEVENLTNDLKRLLVQHEITLDEEGIRHEVEMLERWMESYRRGLAAANKISESGVSWLSQLRDHLKMAAEERQRLEGEGGNPATKEQIQRTEELLAAANRIDRAIPDIEQIFSHAPVEEDA